MASAVVGSLRVILGLDTAEFQAGTREANRALSNWSKDFGKIGQQATQLGSQLTAAITVPLVGLAAGSAKLAMDFESSFAGVRKTVEATEPEFAAMAQQFRNLAKEIPINVNELNRLGEAAGAMGIPKEAIVDFTKTMALLGVTTNLTSEQAAESIGKIQNIFQAAGKDTDRFASTLVALGNAGASTEQEIVKMAARIAGAGQSVGLTQANVLSFANALASVGIEAEAGGSAISRIFLKMNDAVMDGGAAMDEFARVADVSSAAFKKAFEEDASQAMVMFVKGLGRLKAEGENTNATMEGMIGKNIILKDTLNRLSGSGDLLSKSLALGNKAWQDNNALTEEARKRFETTQAQLTLLWNRVKDVGITLGNAMLPAIKEMAKWTGNLIPIIENAAKWFTALPGPIQAVSVGLLGLAAAAGPLLLLVGQLSFAMSSLTATFGAGGLATKTIVPMFTSLFGVLGGGSAVVGTLTKALGFLVSWPVGVAASVLSLTGTWDEFFRILKAGVEIVYNIGAAIVGFGIDVVKWFGEISGLTEIVTGAFNLFGQVLRIIGGEIAWFMDKLAVVMEGLAAVTGGMERELSKVEIASPFKKLIGEGLGPAMTATDALRLAQEREVESSKKQGKQATDTAEEIKAAKKKAEKAAKDHEAAIKAEEQALSALGLVTEKEVNEKIVELTKLQELATKAGVPLVASLKAQETVLKALAAKAKESGVEFSHLTELIIDLQREIHALSPTPQALPVKMGLPAVITGLQAVSLGISKAAFDARELGGAYETLGVTSQRSLDTQAQAARYAYSVIAASGTATRDQLIAARQAVLDAEIAAGQRTIGLWEGEIKPALENVFQGISGSLARGLTDMIGHWSSAGEIMKEVWQGVKNTFLNVLEEMLSSFINGFLKGLIDGIVGANLGKTLAASLSGGFGGSAKSGVVSAAADSVGVGGAGAGAGLGGLGAGLLTVGSTLAIFDALLPGPGGIIEAFTQPNFISPEAFQQQADLWGLPLDQYMIEWEAAGRPGFFAKGGIATKATLGVFGEAGPEVLLPLDQLGAMLSHRESITPQGAEVDGAGWGGGETRIVFEVDGRTTAEYLLPYHVAAARRLGLAGTF